MTDEIRVGDRGTYVETIAWKNMSNPFTDLIRYGAEDVQRLPENSGFTLGDTVIWEVEKDNYRYCSIEYIARVINICELYDEVVFFLNSHKQDYPLFSRYAVFNPKKLIDPKDFELEENSILLHGPNGRYGIFNGYDGYDVDDYAIVKQNIPEDDKNGDFLYDIHIPDFAAGFDASKIPRQKHVSKMDSLNDDEIRFLREREINIIIAKNLKERWN